MAEEIHLSSTSKEDKYKELLPQIKALIAAETDLTANMANVCAALKFAFDFFWVGFYVVKNDQLVLGPFQGPVACTRISKGRGVCGSSWLNEEIIIVDDVETFPGHIACSALSKSEIVLPLYNAQQKVIGVLDVDSDEFNSFDQNDAYYLNEIIKLLNVESHG